MERNLHPGTLLFRVLREDEIVSSGIIAKAPEKAIRQSAFLRNGSRAKTQFIATTNDLSVAIKWARKRVDDARIAVINRKTVCASGAAIYDVSDRKTSPSVIAAYPGETLDEENAYIQKAADYAYKSAEVDIVGTIPTDAFFLITLFEYDAFIRSGIVMKGGFFGWMASHHSFGE